MKNTGIYRKQIYALLILFVIILCEFTLFNYFRVIFNAKPDAVLVVLVYYVAFFNLGWSVVFAFLAGVFRDIFSLLPFGINAISFIVWIILAKQISRRLSVENNFIRAALLFLIIVLNNLTTQSFLFALDRPVAMNVFFKSVLTESILTLLLGIPMYSFFTYLFVDRQ
jgi:rod shape-determining protein MreD